MDRIVVITGGSSGLGKCLSGRFVKAGDTVCTLSRSNPDNTDKYYHCDVSKPDEVRAAMDAIGAEYGRIDVLINNAGVGITGAIELLSDEIVQKSCDINFMGVFYGAKYALPYMRRGGKIINMSSTTAFFALPYRAVYCANKAAVSYLSYGLRMELRTAGIQVCAMCPGDTKTNFSANRVVNVETNERYGDRIKNSVDQIAHKEDSRMSQEAVSDKIFCKINKKKLKPYYIVGAKFKFLMFCSWLFPQNFMLNMTDKMFGGYKKY